jgi:hypothetical protein
MPRAERLSSRLDTLLEAVFDAPTDPFSLYGDIAAQIRRDQLAQAQKSIRKTLRQRGEIRAESAILVACVLHLTGFPAHRILHFLSLYVPGGIRLSLFELAVSAIFPGEPPLPAALLYDLTQYTYLEKRLLVRKSMEISETLKGSLSPAVLLYLYLLSLRDDLSNENIQLIALIMKSCFPALEVRTRIGGASLEEYGEIARAWKSAEQRSRDLDLSLRSGAERRSARAFDRDSASFFLDKYFSDAALAEMRASAPAPAPRRVPPRSEPARAGLATTRAAGNTSLLPPDARTTAASRAKSRVPPHLATVADSAAETAPDSKGAGVRPYVRGDLRLHREPATATEGGIRAATEATVSRAGGGNRAAVPRASTRAAHRGLTAPTAHAARTARRPALSVAPIVIAAVVVAAVLALLLVPGPGTKGPVSAPASQPVIAAPPQNSGSATLPAGQQPLLPSAPPTRTYVVRPGDSLWKIFTSLRPQSPDRKGWMDFLSKAQSLNGLGDPDQLQPGKVLTLSGQE